jgi:hypothetical protein
MEDKAEGLKGFVELARQLEASGEEIVLVVPRLTTPASYSRDPEEPAERVVCAKGAMVAELLSRGARCATPAEIQAYRGGR